MPISPKYAYEEASRLQQARLEKVCQPIMRHIDDCLVATYLGGKIEIETEDPATNSLDVRVYITERYLDAGWKAEWKYVDDHPDGYYALMLSENTDMNPPITMVVAGSSVLVDRLTRTAGIRSSTAEWRNW